MTAEPTPSTLPFEPALWRHERSTIPEIDLAFADTKARFWARPQRLLAVAERKMLDVKPTPITDRIWAKSSQSPGVAKPVREGDSNLDYSIEIVSQMQHATPQFNLRNVRRVTRNVELEHLEWGATPLPDRKGFEEDLVEVRNARHEAPQFYENQYATVAVQQLQQFTRVVFIENDWEQWYGEDKKRAMGALWRWIPPDGGRRTRPFPKDMLITPHKYWKGRLITEEF